MDVDEPQGVSFSPIYMMNSPNLAPLAAFEDNAMFGLYKAGTDDIIDIGDGM